MTAESLSARKNLSNLGSLSSIPSPWTYLWICFVPSRTGFTVLTGTEIFQCLLPTLFFYFKEATAARIKVVLSNYLITRYFPYGGVIEKTNLKYSSELYSANMLARQLGFTRAILFPLFIYSIIRIGFLGL